MLTLSTSYANFLATRKSTEIITRTNINALQQNLFLSTVSPRTIVIAPLNANLEFSSIPRLSLTSLVQATADAPIVDLPPYFDWKDKNSKVTAPVSQGHCGCCWAVAVATCISDNFVVQGLTPTNPNLSFTFLMSCSTDNMKCGGGNPALCLSWIQKNGIAPTSSSYNFDWCLQNDLCTGKKLSGSVSSDELNQLIPGCIDPAPMRFFIRSIETPQLTEEQKDDPQQRELSTNAVKRHMMMKGPVVGGFHVFSNFFGGNYTCNGDNPDNIYLEKVNYETCQYTDKPFTLAGGHAVVLTGWGTGRVKGRLLSPQHSPEQFYNVPYWIVRNSWGTAWGNDGYFRIAQYPFNQQSQFDTTIFIVETVQDPETNQYVQQKIPVGGMIFFEAGYFGTDKPVESFDGEDVWGRESFSFCQQQDSTSSTVRFFIVGMLLFLIFFTLLILIFSIKKKCKPKTSD